jgi:hypothetical protein
MSKFVLLTAVKRLDPVCAWIILALGVVHVCVTPFVYSHFSQSAVWFAGSGLAGIFAGMLNLLRIRHGNAISALHTFSMIANLLSLVWIIAGTASLLPALRENPQALILLVAILVETLFSANKNRLW